MALRTQPQKLSRPSHAFCHLPVEVLHRLRPHGWSDEWADKQRTTPFPDPQENPKAALGTPFYRSIAPPAILCDPLFPLLFPESRVGEQRQIPSQDSSYS